MLIFGKWKDNITCKRCRYRHPADVTCKLAREVAHANRRESIMPLQEYPI